MENKKPREFWINEIQGAVSFAEESIDNGYSTHTIEYSAYEQLKAENKRLRDALEFYASDVYWNKTSVGYYDRIDCSDTNLLIDGQVGGKRARAALKGE